MKKACGKFNHQWNKTEKQSPPNEDVAGDNGPLTGDAIVIPIRIPTGSGSH